MEVRIICDPQIDNPEKVVFEKFKETCLLGLNHFRIEILNTEYIYEK